MARVHHDVAEELLEAIWVLGEQSGGPVQAAAAQAECHIKVSDESLALLEREGLVRLVEERVELTAAGERQAAFIIRRQRLGEILALRMMGFVHGEEAEAVCEFEHVLTSDEDIDRLCTQLAHPTTCPDGDPIPPGPCCDEGRAAQGLCAVSLAELSPPATGRILYVRRRIPSRVRTLQSYGIILGARFTLSQRVPALVLTVEGVDVALDSEVARDVFVCLD